MINLIPNKEKKEMLKGFYFRVSIIVICMVGAAFFIATVAMLPAYFLASVKNKIALSKLEVQAKEPVPLPDQETLSAVNDLEKKLQIVEQQGNIFSVSKKIVEPVLSKKTSQIKITDLGYQHDPLNDPPITISVQGRAASREALLDFKKSLEDDPNFKKVNLPISNLAKGSDIQFYLSLIPQ